VSHWEGLLGRKAAIGSVKIPAYTIIRDIDMLAANTTDYKVIPQADRRFVITVSVQDKAGVAEAISQLQNSYPQQVTAVEPDEHAQQIVSPGPVDSDEKENPLLVMGYGGVGDSKNVIATHQVILRDEVAIEFGRACNAYLAKSSPTR
jgi:hypothetical protein